MNKNIMLSVVLACATFTSACKSDDSLRREMQSLVDSMPYPRTYSECSSEANVIRQYVDLGRDDGASVQKAISMLRLVGGGLPKVNQARERMFKEIWKSDATSRELSDMFMDVCS